MKKAGWFLLGFVFALLALVLIRTMSLSSLQKKVLPEPILDFGRPAAEHLSQAIAFPTISSEMNQPVDTAVFRAFHRFLAVTYPKVHATLKKETFSEFSLLYTWEGRNKTLKPIILMAHLDVVPAGDPDLWKHAPFSGDINGTQIWGRGAMDDKASMISILEAVERLLSEKIRPERTLYLAFGHDEEIGGTRGAQVMASELEKRGVLAEYILDEGMAITRGMVPMVRKPVALIGTSEKGQMSVKLSVEMPGGHSSTPEKETAISVLNKALGNVFTHPAKPHIAGSVNDFIRYVAPEMPYYAKVLFANLWLFRHIVTGIYQKTGSGNALVRTTVAPTILQAGTKANVLPTRAEAILNYRILPGEKSSEVLNRLKLLLSDDRVLLTVLEGRQEPSPISPVNTPGFEAIHTAVSRVYPEVLVAPTLMLASSDGKSFSHVSRNIYKFAPLMVTSADMSRIHGANERIAIKDFNLGINFYYRLLKISLH